MHYTSANRLHHGRYQLVSRLHETATSVVWRAIDLRHDTDCAIKCYDMGPVDTKQLARVQNEAKITSGLDHPHITPVLDAFEDGTLWCLVMPLAAGNLADWLALRGAVDEALVVDQFLGVLDALQQIHDLGIVHRDIKPSNLLITGDGILQLADFGIAHLATHDDALTTTGAIMGSLAYMSPEQRAGYLAPTHQSDLYSLGIAFTEALIGEAMVDLFAERQRARLQRLVSTELAEILLKACAYEPQARFLSASEMAGALRAHFNRNDQRFPVDDFGGLPLDAPVPTAPERPTPVPPVESLSSGGLQMWQVLLISIVALGVGMGLSSWWSPSSVSQVQDAPSVVQDPWAAYPKCDEALVSLQGQHVMGPRESLGVAAKDMDGDGWNDLVYTNQLDETLSIYWGNPAGSMDQPLSLSTLRSESHAAVGDVDKDGFMDLIVASPDEAAFALHRGGPGRSFGQAETFFQGSRPSFPRLLDWDGDETLDLLFTHLDCIAWRKGDGAGGFGPHACLGNRSRIKGTIDHDQDGRIELIVPLQGGIEFWERDAGGWVGERRRIATLAASRMHLSVADIDPASGPELYVVRPYGVPSVLRLAAPDWTPCALAQTLLPFELHAMTATDINNDGAVDFVGTRTCAGCTSNHLLYRGQARGVEPAP